MIKRILLINPPHTLKKHTGIIDANPPLGLAYIAAVLRDRYDVRICDAVIEGIDNRLFHDNEQMTVGLRDNDILSQIRDFAPDVVGVSSMFSDQYHNAHRMCALAKKVSMGIITVMGGAHASYNKLTVMQDKNVDFVIVGEGEESFGKLLSSIANNTPRNTLDGLCWRDANGEVKCTPKTSFIKDLDQIPFPAHDLLPIDKYCRYTKHRGLSKGSPYCSVITSRGCPANCIFCSIHSVWGKSYRTRSPENVIAEIKHLKSHYNINEIAFEDDNLTYDKNRAIAIFDLLIENQLDISWSTPNGVALWSLDTQVLDKMRDSGCFSVVLAVESGDQEVLSKLLKKPLKLKKVEKLVRYAKKIGLETGGLFVIGAPGETTDQMHRTIKYMFTLPFSQRYLSILTPYPGTKLWDICKKNGYVHADIDLRELKLYQANISTPEFKAEEVQIIYNLAQRAIKRRRIFNAIVKRIKNAF
ncbi:B12-binding domain-containing radical SAM protein [Desulfosarcina ovata]|uniref:B12-binding domain-containing radical SAM protein n=1 Tax=Desulfosarcina ovata subsp. ovata TaxID=2752305 RepID=A0A5K8A306_9BACT|nr:radical SAM protein [Desulfosarcina ovata]BBO86919.1 B12-binding domain-containing radical SAM protein [Desulfosarcina ovata subsp. ovata]